VFFARTRESSVESKRLMNEAIELDGGFARAHGFLAWLHSYDYRYGWSDDPQRSLDLALDAALRALALDSFDYESHWRLGVTYLHRRQFEKALSQYEKARALNPHHAGFLAEMAGALILIGRADEAIVQVERAMRINPNHPEWFLAHLGWAYYEAGRYEEALASLDRMNNPPAVYLPLVVATLVRLGRIDEATETALELRRREPAFTLATLRFWPYRHESARARIAADLRAAGIPD
jgi:tetratricopeptide (TPR) repeat protein